MQQFQQMQSDSSVRRWLMNSSGYFVWICRVFIQSQWFAGFPVLVKVSHLSISMWDDLISWFWIFELAAQRFIKQDIDFLKKKQKSNLVKHDHKYVLHFIGHSSVFEKLKTNVLPVSDCQKSLGLMVSPDFCWKLLTFPLSLKVRWMLNLRMLVSWGCSLSLMTTVIQMLQDKQIKLLICNTCDDHMGQHQCS